MSLGGRVEEDQCGAEGFVVDEGSGLRSWSGHGRAGPTRVEDLGVERHRDDDGEEQWRVRRESAEREDGLRRKRTAWALIVGA